MLIYALDFIVGSQHDAAQATKINNSTTQIDGLNQIYQPKIFDGLAFKNHNSHDSLSWIEINTINLILRDFSGTKW